MKKLILTSLALVALASCQKESTVDSAITSGSEITYAPYASVNATKGSAVSNNTDFAGTDNSFYVAAYNEEVSYFGFRKVTYEEGSWVNATSMYWPNESTTLHFGAYYPADAIETTDASFSGDKLSFDYTVEGAVADQIDLMYAITDLDFVASTDEEEVVGLHFKHALTQIGFTATKDADINVSVTSVKICNVVQTGAFAADGNTNDDGSITEDQDSDDATSASDIWTIDSTIDDAYANYSAVMASTDAIVVVADEATTLTSSTDVMMLLPQMLLAWDPTGETIEEGDTDEGSYLAIKCTITHSDGTAAIVDGTVYVPFDTGATLDGAWEAGYKITYNLHFGGGYTIPSTGDDDGDDEGDEGDEDEDDGDDDPEPGEVPTGVVETLRPITYTVTVDDWIPSASVTVDGTVED